MVKKNHGFSLVEVLVAVGLLGGVAGMSMKLSSNAVSIARSMNASVDSGQVRSEITSILSKSEVCSDKFAGLRVASSANGSPVGDLSLSVPLRPGLNLKAGENYSPTIMIKDLTMTNIERVQNGVFSAEIGLYLEKVGVTKVIDEKGKEVGSIMRPQFYTIYMSVDAGGSVQNCSGGMTDQLQANCQSMAGLWDAQTRTCDISPAVADNQGVSLYTDDQGRLTLSSDRLQQDVRSGRTRSSERRAWGMQVFCPSGWENGQEWVIRESRDHFAKFRKCYYTPKKVGTLMNFELAEEKQQQRSANLAATSPTGSATTATRTAGTTTSRDTSSTVTATSSSTTNSTNPYQGLSESEARALAYQLQQQAQASRTTASSSTTTSSSTSRASSSNPYEGLSESEARALSYQLMQRGNQSR